MKYLQPYLYYLYVEVICDDNLLLCFRQGDYRYKTGTTAVMSEEVRKFEVVSETVERMEVA